MFQIIAVTSETILLETNDHIAAQETMETLKEINKYRHKLMWIAQKIKTGIVECSQSIILI